MSHPAPQGDLHYHFWGACLVKDYGFWDDSVSPNLCKNDESCYTTAGDFTLAASNNFYVKSNWDKPIGLARDGHIILGPWNGDGDRWSCSNRDVCNGAFVGENKDTYAYVGSDTFPYVVGCWGPGPAPDSAPTCSTNGCGA